MSIRAKTLLIVCEWYTYYLMSLHDERTKTSEKHVIVHILFAISYNK